MIRRWGRGSRSAVVVGVALAVVLWPNGEQSTAARAHELETEIKCPECQGLSVADSQAPTSRAIRADIKRRIAAGQSDAEIRQAYVDHYGETILLAPQDSGLEPASCGCCPSSCSCSAPPASCSRCGATATSRSCTRPRPTSGLVRAGARRWLSVSTAERRRQLEEERDFLMRSLDDLELERESGGIDDESYARAARRLHRAGGRRHPDAARRRRRHAGADAPPSPGTARRRALLIAGVVGVRGRSPGSSLAYALGARLPGQTASGNSPAAPSTTNAAQKAVLAQDQATSQAKVNAEPRRLRPPPRSSPAPTRRTATSRTRSSSPTPRSPSTRTVPKGTRTRRGCSTSRPEQVVDKETRTTARRPGARRASTEAIRGRSRLRRRVLLPRRALRGDATTSPARRPTCSTT